MMDVVLELLLVWTCGCFMLLAAFVVGDVTGDWIARELNELHRRCRAAWIKAGWQDVAARHRRRVKV